MFINVLTQPNVKYDRKFLRAGGNGKPIVLVNGASISRFDDRVAVARKLLLHVVIVLAVVSAEDTDCFPVERLLPTTMFAKHDVLTKHNITETMSNMFDNRDGYVVECFIFYCVVTLGQPGIVSQANGNDKSEH